MWINQKESGLAELVIKKELKPIWQVFFEKNIALTTLQTTSLHLIESLENNFFEYYKLNKANQYYAKMCLLVMLEEKIDINALGWKDFSQSSFVSPQKILLLANNHNYRLVKEAANFLYEFNSEINIDLNDLPNSSCLDPSLNTQLFRFFELESFKKMQYLHLENDKIARELKKDCNSTFTISTEPFLRWEMLNMFTTNQFYLTLFIDLIKQKIIHPGLKLDQEKYSEDTLFEFLMFRQTPYSGLITEFLFDEFRDEFNLKEAIPYLRSKYAHIGDNFKNNGTQIPKGLEECVFMIKRMETFFWQENLNNSLKEKEGKGSGSKTKI